jgi:hypothetical protein
MEGFMSKIDKWFDNQKIISSDRYDVSDFDIEELIKIVREDCKDVICHRLRYEFEGPRDTESLESFIESLIF